MRVYYRSRRSWNAGTVFEQAGQPAFCCDTMARQWGNLIGFGVKGHRRSTSREVNLYSMLAQVNRGPICLVAEIAFCPFCGEVIEAYRAKGQGLHV